MAACNTMTVRNLSLKPAAYGTYSQVQPENVPRGAASSSLNWLTKLDRIELRYGMKYLGTSSVQTGVGLATAIKRATGANGIEQLFGTYGKKAKYFSLTTSEWVEISSDLLGANVVDSTGYGKEPIFLSEYESPAGNQIWLNSPNCAGYYKIMIANPGDAYDQYDSTKNFKGNIKIDTNRTFLWGTLKDKTGVYGSYIDTQTYTTVTAEALASVASGTLAFKAGGTKRTCFGLVITVTVGGVTYTDNYSGVLTGSDGTAGTINYSTGAFTTPAAGAGTATYQWEDATNNGIADFTKAGTRLAGQGFVFRQDEGGGPIENLNIYNTVYYAMHLKKTWALNLSSDDTQATNLPYRQNVGIPSPLASCDTGNGIFYIDEMNGNDKRVRVLTYDTGGAQQVIPIQVSTNVNLNALSFDQSASIEFGDLVLFSCATADSTRTINGQTVSVNNRVLVYNKLWRSFDLMDYNVSCFEVYNNGLVSGDSLSNNFIELFSGFDDLGSNIENYWIGNSDDFTVMPKGMTRMRNFYEGIKKCKKLMVRGQISADQAFDVYAATDNGEFSKVGTIAGNGTYVDKSSPITIGSRLIGSTEIGGEGETTVYNYEYLFQLRLDRFEKIMLKFVATGIGYVSIDLVKYWDLRSKGKKVPQKYRQQSTV